MKVSAMIESLQGLIDGEDDSLATMLTPIMLYLKEMPSLEWELEAAERAVDRAQRRYADALDSSGYGIANRKLDLQQAWNTRDALVSLTQ
tara:strand:+ start:1176 stop:1445 length:270 start_codon:yes stop_codon:yes gene_type:complete